MDIKNLAIQDLEVEQVENVINFAIAKTVDEVDRFAEMTEEEIKVHATFKMAKDVTAIHVMLKLMEVSHQIQDMTTLCQLELIKQAMEEDDKVIPIDRGIDVEEIYTKYGVLNNKVLSVLLFEVSKDVLTEDEFMECLYN